MEIENATFTVNEKRKEHLKLKNRIQSFTETKTN